jgi:hypothetical protein
MFDSKQTLTRHLSDAVDLMIDFATLGEYGLEEPVGRASLSCETRRRTAPPGAQPRRRAGNTQARRSHRIDGPFLLRP